MKVASFIKVGFELVPAEIEITLSSGLPQFHFIGLVDTALKESGLRIRSAIREQGFDFPQQQILVHIKPTFLRKTSCGLDLAIASALLWETGQLTQPRTTPVVYGELTLKGEVVAPDDLADLPSAGRAVITGVPTEALSFRTQQITNLAQLTEEVRVTEASDARDFERPPVLVKKVPREAAEFAQVVAAGEHSILLLGPAGSGKSTLAEMIPALLEPPSTQAFREVRQFWRGRLDSLTWRPVLRPHHSITPLAMIGGGSSLWPGEITRAHGGVLIMDELLEFAPEIQEALREPVELGSISIVRGGQARTYPAQVLLIGTSNLCPCGNFVPRRAPLKPCRCPRADRRRGLTRLTGPFADRFALIALTDTWSESPDVSVEQVAEAAERAIVFRKRRGQSVPNARLAPEAIEDSLDEFTKTFVTKAAARSRRRRAALLRVARTVADLRESLAIQSDDIETARRLTVQSHRLLEDFQD